MRDYEFPQDDPFGVMIILYGYRNNEESIDTA